MPYLGRHRRARIERSQHALLLHLGHRLSEQPWLLVRGFDAAAGYVKVLRLQLDADELTAKVGTRYASGAAAHEGVNYSSACPLDNALHDIDGLFCWVKPVPRPNAVQTSVGRPSGKS